MADKSKMFVCVLCDKTFYGFGNNPAPLKKKGYVVKNATLEKFFRQD